MHRFFIPPDVINKNNVSISGTQAYQMKEVLRLKSGDHIILLDNTGTEYEVEIVDIKQGRVSAIIVNQYVCPNEPELQITLFQSLLKSDKFELALQKGTELGVSKFIPIICERCIVKTPGESRINRWRKILVEASEQSGRGKIPCIEKPVDFQQACNDVNGLSIIPWEHERGRGIKTTVNSFRSEKCINIFIGPEGGLTQSEVVFAQNKGIIPVTLGKRILRAETAGLATAAIIMYEFGEM